MGGSLGRSVGEAILALHRRLLPATPHIGWIPYLWLFWLIGFFAKWFFVAIDPVELTLALLTLPVFLALYFNGFWHSGRRVFVNIAGILLIGLLWTPFNPNALSFFIYGSAFVGRASRPPRAYAWLGGVVSLIAVEWLLFDLSFFILVFGGALSVLIGTAAIHSDELDRQDVALKLSQAEARRLAAVAERERIGRDLHDLLGHTLSLITIKAEFAAKLAARGDGRAEREIREVERISRGALREIREAVNLAREDGWIRLMVADDGRGGPVREGAGLAGMRERVEEAGGEMTIETTRGVTLTVRIPADPGRPTSGLPASREAAA